MKYTYITLQHFTSNITIRFSQASDFRLNIVNNASIVNSRDEIITEVDEGTQTCRLSTRETHLIPLD